MIEETPVKSLTPPQGTYELSGEDLSLAELDLILTSTIKYDSPTKKILFLSMTLNYTGEDQQNLAFSGPSAGGKSFIALEVSNYFPEEDLLPLAYTSPTAFFHSQGVLVDQNLSPLQDKRDYVTDHIDIWDEKNPQPKKGEGRTAWKEKRRDAVRAVKAEWDQLTKYYMVNLEQKILIFLDQPHDELLKKLRPLLSHDKKHLMIKITDKTREGGHKTKDIIIVGFPTVMFLSVDTSLSDQEKTRNFLLSPEITQEKLEASILQIAEVQSNRADFKDRVNRDAKRKKLIGLIRSIKEANIKEIQITPEDRDYITAKFLAEHEHLEPRHQRDFPRLFGLIKGYALLNMFNRVRVPGTVWANRHDCDVGYKLYREVSKANEEGLPPHIYNFWVKALKPQLYEEGLTRKQVSRLYLEHYKTRIGEKALKRLIETLAEAGHVYEAKDPTDKRFIKIYPLDGGGEIYLPGGGGKNFTQIDDENKLQAKLMDEREEYFKKLDEEEIHLKDTQENGVKSHSLTDQNSREEKLMRIRSAIKSYLDNHTWMTINDIPDATFSRMVREAGGKGMNLLLLRKELSNPR